MIPRKFYGHRSHQPNPVVALNRDGEAIAVLQPRLRQPAFDWGNTSPGARELAVAMIRWVAGAHPAPGAVDRVLEEVVSRLSDPSFEISSTRVLDSLARHREQAAR